MAIKKKKDEGGGGSDWLGTYSDMVTLLLTFFILLFSMSTVDAVKYQKIVEAFTDVDKEVKQSAASPPANGDPNEVDKGGGSASAGDSAALDKELPENFDELYQYIKAYVEKNKLTGSVDVQKGEHNVFIRFRDNIFFKPDSSNLQRDGTNILNFLGNCFNELEDQILAVRVNGHTATVPNSIKTPGFDRTLSTDRANAVLTYFEETKHFNPKKLIAIGYGRNYPVASNSTEAGRRQNRRVDIMILSNNIKGSSAKIVNSLLQGNYDADTFKDDETSDKILIPEKPATEKDLTTTKKTVGNADNTKESTGEKTQDIEKNISPYKTQ